MWSSGAESSLMTLISVEQKLKGRVEQESSGVGPTLFSLPLAMNTAALHPCLQAAWSNICFFLGI